MKHLDNMSNDAIMLLNLPTGIPFVYELDENMKPVKSMEVSELPLHQIKIIKQNVMLNTYLIMISSYSLVYLVFGRRRNSCKGNGSGCRSRQGKIGQMKEMTAYFVSPRNVSLN